MAQSNNVKNALEEAEKLVAALRSFDQGSPAEHLAVLKLTDKVRMALEEPYDITTRLLENMSVSAALYTLLDIGALQKLPADGNSISAVDLAGAVNVDVSAITRMMRVIISNGIAIETAPDEYMHNVLSQVYQPQALGAFFLVCMDFMKTWVKLPEYFKSHTPEDLSDLKKSPFAFAVGKEGLTYYEVLNLDVEQRNIWNMTLQQMEKNMPILGMFPFATLKEQVEKEPERPFIVDVGGGRGQALLAIQTECPGAFGGKLILQDLPIVIDSLKPEEIAGIEPMVYDIFTPQPVKSECYFFFAKELYRRKHCLTRCRRPHLFHAPPSARLLRSYMRRDPEEHRARNGSGFATDHLRYAGARAGRDWRADGALLVGLLADDHQW
jgi:hypothetical protein